MSLGVVISLLEFVELSVHQSILNMVCKGQHVKGILVGRIVVNFHVVVDGLFVAQVEVVFLMVSRG